MTKKELKNLAKEIAKYERIVQTTEDTDIRYHAEEMIISLTNKVTDFEEMLIIDEMILKILENN